MEKQYFVDWIAFNAETQKWYFKQAESCENLDTAKKKYHSLLSQKIGYGAFTHVVACIYDQDFKIIARETWDGTWEAPEVEPVDETSEA